MNTFIKTLFFVLLCFGCNSKNPIKKTNDSDEAEVKIKYAKGFEINALKNKKILKIKYPYINAKEVFSYVLQTRNSTNKIAGTTPIIYTPVQKIVVTSTTDIPILELLGVEKTLVGFPHTKYISSPKTRKLIENSNVKEIGVKAALNTEILLDIHPEVVVGFTMSKNNKPLNLIEKSGIPVILNGSWLEETPLGRAEWIKFFGILYNKEKEADSIFNVIEKNYLKAKHLAKNATKSPTILSGAVMSKDIWNLPAGNSFVAQFLKDANTRYLWGESKGTGSLSISFESVLDKGKEADIWIAPGYFRTKQQMLSNNTNYKTFKAFKNNQIFTFANTLGETGGSIYFELGPVRPDLVLKDIIKIAHPALLPSYTPTFFKKMN